MHLAEGTIPLVQALGWSAAAIPALAWSIRGEQRARSDSSSASVVMAGATSLLFAVTLLPLPIPVLGATSHLCLTPLLALIVGVRRIIWPTFFVLLLQALFFAHGGLTTLGVNTLTLGLLGPLIAVGVWGALQRLGAGNVYGLAAACLAGDLGVYLADALVLAAALSDAVRPSTTFAGVLVGFAPVQGPLALVEAVASVGIVRVLAGRRPDLLPASLRGLRTPTSTGASLLLVLLVTTLAGCGYEGIDGTVFGAVAESAGRPPTDSIVDFSQGEFGLAMTIIVLFGLGFVAGSSWQRLVTEERTASPDG
ncbi:MAG: energy-coupling factor ABC transporter permease [Myxococcota bacterium]|nr:energy-coupling factor ABC transporter permease [Myxococcota bacterium]